MLVEDSERIPCRWRSVSVEHLDEIRNDVESLRGSGSLDSEFHVESLANLSYEVPKEIPNAKFIIIASTPQPAVIITFSWKGGRVPAIVPPTYAQWEDVNRSIQKILEKEIRPFRIIMAFPPLKTLAARSGLASYGRCNLSFVPGMGSYHRLVAFFTDYPDLEDQWQERQVLPRCGDCGACINACPTRAILPDRFLIKAERCLTNLNERSSQRPFPDWVESEWHNCIVGCMLCQRACPENKGKLVWLGDQMDFSEVETRYLLKGGFDGEEAKQVETKLKKVGLDLSLFPRNLRALLNEDEV